MSLPGLASHVRLDDLHASIGVFLDDLRAGGPIAKVAALAGTGAVLIGCCWRSASLRAGVSVAS